MGQIQNKTYTAPDGSVYRVEDDGSITKIKGGKIQSNEPPSKYQITPEGKIYRVESDGSVTYLSEFCKHLYYLCGFKRQNIGFEANTLL